MNTNPHVFDATAANFESDVLQGSLQAPVLVDFWATWCGPCKTLGPILEKLAAEYNGAFRLAKVDVDVEQQLAGAFQIRSVPTVILVKDGQPVDGFPGALPEGQLRQFLSQHGIEPAPLVEEEAGPEVVSEAPPAPEVLEMREQFARQAGDAPPVEVLQASIDHDPADLRARHLLGVQLMAAGRYEAALEQFMEMLQRDRKFDDGLPRRALIDAFVAVDDAALVGRYRRRMSSLLLS